MNQLEENFEVSGTISLRRHSIVIPATAAFNLAPVTGSPAPRRRHSIGRPSRRNSVTAQNSVDLSTGGASKPPRAVGTSHFLPAGWINAAISGTTRTWDRSKQSLWQKQCPSGDGELSGELQSDKEEQYKHKPLRPDDRVPCGRPQLGLQWSNQTVASGVVQEEVQTVDQHLLKEVMLMEALSEVHLAHEILMMEAGEKRGRKDVESGAVWTCILQVRYHCL